MAAPWSLRLRLLAIIGASLLSVWSLVAVWMLVDVRNEIRTALDDRLAASARMVAGLMLQLPAGASPGTSPAVSPLDVIGRDGLACEVSLLRGEVMIQTLARTSGSPGLGGVPTGYSTHTFGGKPWRTYVLEQGGIRIATADRIDVREGLLRDI
ncbi:MAG: sensor histidine kinase N-terminal domain-containing protein, partial [Gammaproteobacteria bacterium]|nr:sensor histidine kinase N-terminal domain-containing protein [Gammaproteobacteria bacterium]MBU1443552.1 sensor histidine kinase N-terminal domain-containing protein [Gammaproteobacteria bacterium]